MRDAQVGVLFFGFVISALGRLLEVRGMLQGYFLEPSQLTLNAQQLYLDRMLVVQHALPPIGRCPVRRRGERCSSGTKSTRCGSQFPHLHVLHCPTPRLTCIAIVLPCTLTPAKLPGIDSTEQASQICRWTPG